MQAKPNMSSTTRVASQSPVRPKYLHLSPLRLSPPCTQRTTGPLRLPTPYTLAPEPKTKTAKAHLHRGSLQALVHFKVTCPSSSTDTPFTSTEVFTSVHASSSGHDEAGPLRLPLPRSRTSSSRSPRTVHNRRPANQGFRLAPTPRTTFTPQGFHRACRAHIVRARRVDHCPPRTHFIVVTSIHHSARAQLHPDRKSVV